MRRPAAALLVAIALNGCADGGRDGGDPATAPAPPVVPQGAGDPGPTRVDDGRPAGFATDETGAVAAATTYLATLHGLVGETDERRRTTLASMSAAGADDLAEEATAGFDLLDEMLAVARSVDPTARLYLRGVPVAYDVVAFTPDRASIAVWTLGILVVEGSTLATEVWSTNTVELVHEDGDWRLLSWERRAGPTPSIALTEAIPPSQLLDAIEGWEGYRYVPEP